jgi:glutathione S-transferase
LIRTTPEDQDRDAILASRQKTADALAILDTFFGRTDFVAGADFSICDIPTGVFVYRWFNMDIDREDLPNLRRWYDRLGERPAYQRHIMVPLT